MKKDIKYIVKRVIITLLIIFIVGNLKQCNVFADTNQYYLDLNTTTSNFLSLSNIATNNIIANLNLNGGNLNLSCNVNDLNCYYLLFHNNTTDNENTYLLYYFSADNSFITNYNTYALDLSNFNGRFDYFNGTIYSVNLDIDYSSLNNYSINSDNLFSLVSSMSQNRLNGYRLVYDPTNDNFSFSVAKPSDMNFVLRYYDIVDTNIGKNFVTKKSLVLNNYYENNLDPLQNFTRIDLSGTQSVYFVPKNYNNVPLEQLDDNGTTYSVINFDYYFTGSIKEGFFPLDNPDTPVFTWWENNSSEPEFIDSFFPIYENYQDESGYQYYSYMIYNNYKDSSIWYDANIFDAYLVNDMTNYDETISFIDRNDQEIEKNIKFTKSIQQIWEQGFEKGGENFINGEFFTGNIEGYFLIVRAPFDFFNDLLDDSITCQSISIPIPFLNSEIHLDCLSSFFQSILGNFYNILFILLNSLLAYRITIHNLDTITDVLNPDDDKLEVINL